MAGNFQPLDQKFAIVDARGNPTEYFIRWAQQRQLDISSGLTQKDLTDYLVAHALQEGSGIQITPDGKIPSNPTIAADVQEILDQISATRGAVLYRGLGGWAALLPGTAGQFLKTNGPGLDPEWASAGPVAGGHAWWKVTVTLTQGGGYPSLGGIEIRPTAGTPNLATGGTPTVSSVLFGSAAEAWNATTAAAWVAGGGAPAWAKYHFTSPVACAQLALRTSTNYFNAEGPKNFQLEYSDDDITYTLAKSVVGEAPWTAAQQRLYSVP